jgi:hypothetical protein
MVSIVQSTVNNPDMSFGNNRIVFRNPRGNKNYYVFYTDDGTYSEIRAEYSTDGTTWTNSPQTVYTSAASSNDISFDVKIYDTGTLLDVYLVLNDEGQNDLVYIKGTISDASNTISWSAEQDIDAAINDEAMSPACQSVAICRTANAELVVAFTEDYRARGKDYRRTNIIGSNGDGAAPSWSSETLINDPSGNTNNQNKAAVYVGLESFSSSYGDRFLLYARNPEATSTSTYEINVWVYDWIQGTGFSSVASDVVGGTAHANTSLRLSAVIDDSDKVHVLRWFRSTGGLYHSAYATAGGLGTESEAGLLATEAETLTITIDRTNDVLYAFYRKATDGSNIYYRSTDAVTISWVAEDSITWATGANFTISSQNTDVESALHLVSWDNGTVRYHEFDLVSETTAYKDVGFKTSLLSADTWKDIVFKTSIRSSDQYKDVTFTTSIAAAPSQGYKDVTFKTSLLSADTYKDIVFQTSLWSADIYKDVVFKTSLLSANTFKDITFKTSLLSADTYKDVVFKTSLISEDIWKDITFKTSVFAVNFKDVAFKTSITAITDYKDITFSTSLLSADTYKDVVFQTSLVSEDIYKDITFKTSLVDLVFKDLDLKTSLLSADTYKDVTFTTSIRSEDMYKDVTFKTSLEGLGFKDVAFVTSLTTDFFFKDITFKTSLLSADTYKDVGFKTSLLSPDTYKDITFKTSLLSADTYKDIVFQTSIRSPDTYKDITFTTSIAAEWQFKDIDFKTSLLSADTYKDVAFKTTLWSPTQYKDIVFKTSLIGSNYKDISFKTSITAGILTSYKDITFKTSIVVLTHKDVTLKTDLVSADVYKDITFSTSLHSAPTYKDVTFQSSIVGLGYKDIAFVTSIARPYVAPVGELYAVIAKTVNLQYSIEVRNALVVVPVIRDELELEITKR